MTHSIDRITKTQNGLVFLACRVADGKKFKDSYGNIYKFKDGKLFEFLEMRVTSYSSLLFLTSEELKLYGRKDYENTE